MHFELYFCNFHPLCLREGGVVILAPLTSRPAGDAQHEENDDERSNSADGRPDDGTETVHQAGATPVVRVRLRRRTEYHPNAAVRAVHAERTARKFGSGAAIVADAIRGVVNR